VRRFYDRHRKSHPFRIGSQVWLRNYPFRNAAQGVAAKLCPRYCGPFVIAEFTSPVSVRLTDAQGKENARAHMSQLKMHESDLDTFEGRGVVLPGHYVLCCTLRVIEAHV
jgi:hypothetical protein